MKAEHDLITEYYSMLYDSQGWHSRNTTGDVHVGVSGCLVKGACCPNPIESKLFPIVCADTVWTTFALICVAGIVWYDTATRSMRRSLEYVTPLFFSASIVGSSGLRVRFNYCYRHGSITNASHSTCPAINWNDHSVCTNTFDHTKLHLSLR